MKGDFIKGRELDDSYFSSHDGHCSGFFDNPNGRYVVLPYLGVASITKKGRPQKLEEIAAFDAAQVSFANAGKINAIGVSSFIGPNGRLAGYDFFKKEDQVIDSIEGIEICSLDPLLEVTSSILGTIKNPNYPFFPGSMVPCAMKSLSYDKEGSSIYSALSISVPKDKAINPFLLMEDVGLVENIDDDYFEKAVMSSLEVADMQKINVEKIYISKKEIEIGFNEIGMALVMCPYVHLPKNLQDEIGKV